MLGNDELDTEMQIRKDDFVSPHCRPIMKAYLGADFEAAKTYQQMDEHGVKTKKRYDYPIKVFICPLVRWESCHGQELLKLFCPFGLTRKLT